MDTDIVQSNGSIHFNKSGEVVIDCRMGCGRKTTMLGTCLCDPCWEAQEHRGRTFSSPLDAQALQVCPADAQESRRDLHADYLHYEQAEERTHRRTVLFDGRDEMAVQALAGNEIWASMRKHGAPDGWIDRRKREYYELNGRKFR